MNTVGCHGRIKEISDPRLIERKWCQRGIIPRSAAALPPVLLLFRLLTPKLSLVFFQELGAGTLQGGHAPVG